MLRIPLFWLRHRGLQAADVFVASYPRSGNSWLRFMLCHVLTGGSDSFRAVNRCMPHIGRHRRAPPLLAGGRLIKTHEPYRRDYRGAIYLVRDVRDVALSEHAHRVWMGDYSGSFDSFLDPFLGGTVNGFGSWASHVRSWLDAQAALGPRFLLLRFEDLRKDPEAALAHVLGVLGGPTDARIIREAVQENTIERMREKEDREQEAFYRGIRKDLRFIRQGAVGGWRRNLTPEQVRRIEAASGDALVRAGYAPAGAEAAPAPVARIGDAPPRG